MRAQVASTPGAIGYGMMGNVNESLTTRYEGNTATPDSVAEQRYPLTVPIYFVAQAEPEGRTRDFLAWLQSPAGQRIISEKYGHVR
jgi:phosphate transport system substrate-binding protein